MDETMRVELERIRDEDNRQNKRLEILEGAMEETRTLTISIHGLAGDMKQMLSEMQKQGESLEKLDNRLGALEQEPGRKWKRIGDSILDTAGQVAGWCGDYRYYSPGGAAYLRRRNGCGKNWQS